MDRIHSVHFEISTTIKYQGEDYEGVLSGTAHMANYLYGADADGHRGEKRISLEECDFDEIFIELGDDKVRYIEEREIENFKEIEQIIFEDCLAKID